MWKRFRTWMAGIPLVDPLQRDQAVTLQWLIFLLLLIALLTLPTALIASSRVDQVVGLASALIHALLLIVAAVVLRRGRFSVAVALVIASFLLFVALNMVPTGLEGSRAFFIALAIPIILAGLLGGRSLLVATSALSIIVVIGIAVLSVTMPSLVGFSPQTYDPLLTSVTYVIGAAMLTILGSPYKQGNSVR